MNEKTQETETKPLASSGNIAVWPAKITKDGKKVYTVSYQKLVDGRQYVSVYPNIGNIELSLDEVLELCLRNKLKVERKNERGTYSCTILNRGTQERVNKQDGVTYKNYNIKTAIAFHKKDSKGFTFGYNCNGVGFYAESEDFINQKIMDIQPEDCFDLLDGKSIFKDGLMASLNKVDNINKEGDESGYKTARLEIKNDDKYLKKVKEDLEKINLNI